MNLNDFISLNEEPKKVSWHIRSEQIKKNFFSVENLNWKKVFSEDPEILGSIINDMLKLSVPGNGRPGKRPSLQRLDAKDLFLKLIGEDFSEYPFNISFRSLKDSRNISIRDLANGVKLDKMLVHRLLNNKQQPSLEHIELIAKFFNKDPSYFLEWRIAYIVTFLNELLLEYTESSILLFKKLRKN